MMLDKNSNKKPFFSIIVPCYNSEKFLNYSIESIINQSFDSWELIAINDGSTDDTLKILLNYAAHDKRVKVLTKQNGGYDVRTFDVKCRPLVTIENLRPGMTAIIMDE